MLCYVALPRSQRHASRCSSESSLLATLLPLIAAVIAFEMTGQLTHLLPIIVAVILANLVAQHLGPSIYDSLIRLKKLPYLPPIIQSSSAAHRIFVQDFMQRDLLYVWDGCTYRYLQHLITSKKNLAIYPFVKNPDSMILLGTIDRYELQLMLENQLNKTRITKDSYKTDKKEMNENLKIPTIPMPQNPSPTCPIHGNHRFRVSVTTIPEEDNYSGAEMNSVRVSGIIINFFSIMTDLFYRYSDAKIR